MACTVMGLVVNSQCDMAGSTLMVDPAAQSRRVSAQGLQWRIALLVDGLLTYV